MDEAPIEIVVVDHGTGNIASLEQALLHVGAVPVRTSEAKVVASGRAAVLPGVGAFPLAMENLRRLDLVEPLVELASSGRPLLGICLGLQLLFEGSTEMGGAEGLGLLPGQVRPLDVHDERLPHIGWASVRWERPHAVRGSLADGTPMYHVHSFAPVPTDPEDVLATAVHGTRFVTAAARGSVTGVQFHPEKSSVDGLELVGNFVRWAGSPE